MVMPSAPAGAPDPRDWVTGPVADMFSSYVAACALSAAHELGLLDTLAAAGSVPVSGPVSGPGAGAELDAGVLRQIWVTLSWADIVTVEGERVTPGAGFAAAYAARGYFYWLVRGNGQMFSAAPALARVSERTGQFYQRDMRAVALGSLLIGETEVEGLFDKLLADVPARTVVDLGCGSGHRLIRVARDHPDVRGIGVDISADAVRVASAAVAQASLGQQIKIRQADVRELAPDPDYADVDTVLCVFMGHDFWPLPNCVRTLRRLRSVFPAAQRLLLCDVAATSGPPGADTTIFTLGFEFAHALMGVCLPELSQGHEAFEAGGWHCAAVQPVTAPPNGFLFQLTPAGPA